MSKNKVIIPAAITPVVGSAAAMYAYIKLSSDFALSKNILKTEGGHFYEWTQGQVYYAKHGSGSPILLIHDLDPAASSSEWLFLRKELTKYHTVYTLDLPGCGRSCKPAIQYTSYLYVQLLKNFIHDVIGEPVDVCATHLSASFVIMACKLDVELFRRIFVINPISAKKVLEGPNLIDKNMLKAYNTPFTGDFNYRLTFNPRYIEQKFKNEYLEDGSHVNKRLKEIYYEAAHLGNGNGKYLYASLQTNYMAADLSVSLPYIKNPIILICSARNLTEREAAESWKQLNKDIDMKLIDSTALYPQIQRAEEIKDIIEENE